ncbi:hypothetical protein SRB5_14970 [Streptomyces sp. RB5]|uniref:Histidine kinase/HSP90-like ATPase domain-containing protein n=1 Tax=Streptomyces smaragdinus TaxID=2585196 RepID=A0A7K0CD50_9ACTN|nr:ATP-binding protein [Streptomyces smaragdinus]MQY11381.1 hypothetical protein [Streptomyces smaragdinus]
MRTKQPNWPELAATFLRHPGSVPHARKWARGVLDEAGASGDVLDVAELLVSEVVTNAVVHGGGEVVTVTVHDDLSLAVWDNSPCLPRPRDAALTDEGGRGLAMLGMFAPGYSVRACASGGKTVRFTPRTYADGWA